MPRRPSFDRRWLLATATIPNPIVRIAFWLLRDHERTVFLDSTDRRMRTFTALALAHEDAPASVRRASLELTARRLRDDDPAHDAPTHSPPAMSTIPDSRCATSRRPGCLPPFPSSSFPTRR